VGVRSLPSRERTRSLDVASGPAASESAVRLAWGTDLYVGVPLGVLLLAAVLLAAWLWPYSALRLAMRLLTRTLLWLRVVNRSVVPRRGPLLLVCTPLSYLGWLVLLAACPRRLRFVVLTGWARQGIPGRLLRAIGALTPDGTDQAALERTLDRAAEALGRGEAVCLFAEACRTQDGQLLTYQRVFERVALSSGQGSVVSAQSRTSGGLFLF